MQVLRTSAFGDPGRKYSWASAENSGNSVDLLYPVELSKSPPCKLFHLQLSQVIAAPTLGLFTTQT